MDVLISIKSQSPNLREYDIWNLQNISNDFKGSELRPQHPQYTVIVGDSIECAFLFMLFKGAKFLGGSALNAISRHLGLTTGFDDQY
jgi:hypothetical protein